MGTNYVILKRTQIGEVIELKLLRELVIVMIICFIGQVLQTILKIAIPGNVIGMIILLFCLLTGIIKTSMIENIFNFLIDHLAFLFLPAGVGLIACVGYSVNTWLIICLISVISTVVVMVTTGRVIQLLKRR